MLLLGQERLAILMSHSRKKFDQLLAWKASKSNKFVGLFSNLSRYNPEK